MKNAGWFALLCAGDIERRRTRCPWLDHLLTVEDEYVKIVMPDPSLAPL